MPKSKSSKRWLKEHFDDPYVKLAQQKGYRSRAAFKLLEIQQKDQFIKPGMIVVDLGAAPGSWCEVLRQIIGPQGKIFALDILPMQELPSVNFIQGDFTEPEVFEKLLEMVDNRKVDLVISDIAPNITGMSEVDQPRSMYLVELAADFAKHVLGKGGTFLVKVFQGEGFDDYLKQMRCDYKKVQIRKPQASRPRSKEVYLLARGFQSDE